MIMEPRVVISSIGPQVRVSAGSASPAQVRLQVVHPRIAVSPVGARGAAGASGDTAGYDVTAAEAISGHRAVYVDDLGLLRAASPGLIPEFPPVGIITAAVMAGAAIRVQPAGLVTEGSWNWNQGPIYLGPNGTLTQVVPLTGAIFEIGASAGPTRLMVAPRLVALI